MTPNLPVSGDGSGGDIIPDVDFVSARWRHRSRCPLLGGARLPDARNVVPTHVVPTLIALLIVTFCGLTQSAVAVPSPALDSIWSGVVLATKAPEAAPPPKALATIDKQLKTIFGYNHFELLGEHLEQIDEPDERWLIPNKVICLRVMAKHDGGKTYRLKLQLFQRTKILASFDAKVDASCPLVIRGPLNGTGQLLFILRVE